MSGTASDSYYFTTDVIINPKYRVRPTPQLSFPLTQEISLLKNFETEALLCSKKTVLLKAKCSKTSVCAGNGVGVGGLSGGGAGGWNLPFGSDPEAC